MSTAARKARKRAGIKFTKAPKVGTPVEDRAVRMRLDSRTFRMVPSKRHLRKLAMFSHAED